MVNAVVLGLASGNRCGHCHGGGVVDGAICACCIGVRLELRRDMRRATSVGCDPSDYPRRWKPVFEWLLEGKKENSERAARDFDRILSPKEAA